MARRHVPILLAARMQFQLRQVADALSEGNADGAEREAAELSTDWSKFGYLAEETHKELCEQIQQHLSAIGRALEGAPQNLPALGDQVDQLDSLLRQLANGS